LGGLGEDAGVALALIKFCWVAKFFIFQLSS